MVLLLDSRGDGSLRRGWGSNLGYRNRQDVIHEHHKSVEGRREEGAMGNDYVCFFNPYHGDLDDSLFSVGMGNKMKLKDFFDCPEEFFIGAVLQFPLYFIVGWPVLAIMGLCGLLWRLGGVKGGNKIFRRLGVPFVVCGSSMIYGVSWAILLAMPFMVWLAPSYGKESWLFKLIKNDFLTRLICFAWYWCAFAIVYAWVR